MGIFTKEVEKIVFKTIHNKFNIGQTVFMMVNDSVKFFKIEEVKIKFTKECMSIKYELDNSPYGSNSTYINTVEENGLFESKEELLKSL